VAAAAFAPDLVGLCDCTSFASADLDGPLAERVALPDMLALMLVLIEPDTDPEVIVALADPEPAMDVAFPVPLTLALGVAMAWLAARPPPTVEKAVHWLVGPAG
jgi:hypothetical protein